VDRAGQAGTARWAVRCRLLPQKQVYCCSTSMPSSLAVCRLMTNSNLVGCITDRVNPSRRRYARAREGGADPARSARRRARGSASTTPPIAPKPDSSAARLRWERINPRLFCSFNFLMVRGRISSLRPPAAASGSCDGADAVVFLFVSAANGVSFLAC
jgi:hypothetical protein